MGGRASGRGFAGSQHKRMLPVLCDCAVLCFVAPKPLFAHFSLRDLAIVDVDRPKIGSRLFSAG